MSDRVKNDVPRLPGGMSPERGMTRRVGNGREPRNTNGRLALVRGASWCFAAGLCALWASPLVALFGAYGVAMGTVQGGRRDRIVCAGCLFVSDLASALFAWALFGLPSGISGFLGGLVPSLVAYASGRMVASGRLRFEWLAGCVLASGALYVGCAQYDAMVQGSNVAAQFGQLMSGLTEQGTSLGQTSALARLVPFLSSLWPAFYVGEGFVAVVVALLGARMAQRFQREQVATARRFSEFDVPLWVVAGLLVGITCLVVGGLLPSVSAVLEAVGWNVILIVRFAFAAQGFSVLEWTLQKHRCGVVLRALAYVGLAYAEVSFFVMSVVGVIDVWANFRHLRRGSVPANDDAGTR